jgi:hypothetical protein
MQAHPNETWVFLLQETSMFGSSPRSSMFDMFDSGLFCSLMFLIVGGGVGFLTYDGPATLAVREPKSNQSIRSIRSLQLN